MKQPDQETIHDWIDLYRERIARKKNLLSTGWYKQKNISIHGVYGSMALYFASLGRALFLNNNETRNVREEFSNASQHILYDFRIAYDPEYPDYLGGMEKSKDQAHPDYGQVDWSSVTEIIAIDGFN